MLRVVEGAPFLSEIPLDRCFGTGVAVSIPKKKWEVITPEDLENARPKIEKNDIVIINTGWHHKYGDNVEYYGYSPGLYKEAGEWLAAKGVKLVGVDQQALDHPLGTAIGPHGSGPLRPDVCEEYEKEIGRSVKEDFPHWEPCHNLLLRNGIMGWENVGGDLEQVVGKLGTGKRIVKHLGFVKPGLKLGDDVVRVIRNIDVLQPN